MFFPYDCPELDEQATTRAQVPSILEACIYGSTSWYLYQACTCPSHRAQLHIVCARLRRGRQHAGGRSAASRAYKLEAALSSIKAYQPGRAFLFLFSFEIPAFFSCLMIHWPIRWRKSPMDTSRALNAALLQHT